MKIIVTGGAGFIGNHIARKLLEKDHEVAVLDDLSVGKKEWVPQEAKFFECDIRDREELDEIMTRFQPDIINHHAAHNDSMDSLENPVKDAKTNIIGSMKLLEVAKKHHVKKVIYASSGGLSYGEPTNIPTKEEHKMDPSYPYGISKHTFEHYLELYKELYDVNYVTLRYGSVYGPRATGGVIMNFLKALKNEEKPVIFGDGSQTRDFVHVNDVVSANLKALKNGDGSYNIGTCTETSINQLWDTISSLADYEKEPIYKERWLGDIDRCKLDKSKAEKELNWSPNIELKKGLSNMIKNQ